MRDELTGFRPRQNKPCSWSNSLKEFPGTFAKRLKGVVFLDVTVPFDTVWNNGIYKLTLLNFLSYILHTISSYLRVRTFEASFQTATSPHRGMRAGVA